LHEDGYDIWGEELSLGKGNAYPIRTYIQFESDIDEQNLDPISGLLESFSRVKPEEVVMLQIIARPADPNWAKIVKDEVDKIKGKIAKPLKMSSIEDDGGISIARTPGETELLKQMEIRGFKAGFETVIRTIYLAPKSIFRNDTAKRPTRAAFNQYASSFNYFAPNLRTGPGGTSPIGATYDDRFESGIIFEKKHKLLVNYLNRALPAETLWGNLIRYNFNSSDLDIKMSILTSEELATIFHPPTKAVLTQPMIHRVESRKIGPPAGLPIYQEGGGGLPGIMRDR